MCIYTLLFCFLLPFSAYSVYIQINIQGILQPTNLMAAPRISPMQEKTKQKQNLKKQRKQRKRTKMSSNEKRQQQPSSQRHWLCFVLFSCCCLFFFSCYSLFIDMCTVKLKDEKNLMKSSCCELSIRAVIMWKSQDRESSNHVYLPCIKRRHGMACTCAGAAISTQLHYGLDWPI